MITFPKSFAEAIGQTGVLRAGSTDLSELRHKGLASGDLIDLRDVADGREIEVLPNGSIRIGALVTLHELATHPMLIASFPGLVQAAGGLATPQIRARASVAGSLLQEVRCWYYRDSAQLCAKKGGLSCLARSGDARFHSAFDTGPCIAPHPSTMAMAFLGFNARIEVDGNQLRNVPRLLGPGADPTQTHALVPGEVVTAVILPPPVVGEHSAYLRTIHRARAEWPLVEVLVRASGTTDAMTGVRLTAGGIANRPKIWPSLGLQAEGRPLSDPTWNTMLDNLGKANLPQAAYKAIMLPTTLRDALANAYKSPAAVGTIDAPAPYVRDDDDNDELEEAP